MMILALGVAACASRQGIVLENRVKGVVVSTDVPNEIPGLILEFKELGELRNFLKDRTTTRPKGKGERWGDSNDDRASTVQAPPPAPYVSIFRLRWENPSPSNQWIFPRESLSVDVQGARFSNISWSNLVAAYPAGKYDLDGWSTLFKREPRISDSEAWFVTEAWPLDAVRSTWTFDPAYRLENGISNRTRVEFEVEHEWKRGGGTNRVNGV